MSRLLRSLLIALCAGLPILFAQSQTTAVLSGEVTDATGAAVPGAKVTVTSLANQLKREASTDNAGLYRVTLLPPGNYEIHIDKQGFAPQAVTSLELTVGQQASLDFKLTVGASSQTVEVTADIPIVESERVQQANTIEQKAVMNLPINRRDYLTFTLLAPGVNDSRGLADSNSFRVKQTPDSGLSFYGSNGRGNNITVDGGEVNDDGGGVRPTVSQEAVQEFQINRTNFTAEHPAARGGVINIVTKGGSNEIHGSAFGFFRHQSMDATDPFAITLEGSTTKRVKPDSNRQQFGGTVGGAIKKDKTFYFLSYEQLRRRENKTVPVLTDPSIFQPTAAQENILRNLPAAAATQLRGSLTASPATVALFTRNSGIFPFTSDDHKGLWRIDHRAGANDQFSLRFNVTNLDETNEGVGALVGYSRGYVQHFFDTTTTGNWTHIFTPTTINESRAQYNYYNSFNGSNDPYGPALEIAGYGFFNRDRFLPANIIHRRVELVDNLSMIRGNHSLKMGAYVLLRNTVSDSRTFMSGRFTFGTLPGAFVSTALASTTLTALQAFNLGLAQSYQQGFGDGVVKANHPLYAGFIQDSWKPRANLTLNYGVRYEIDTRRAPMPTDKNNIAPRFGFAWDPFNDHKTTVRGGFGLFYSTIDFQIDYSVNALAEINGYRQIAQVLTVLNAANPLAVNGPVNIYQTLARQGVIGLPTPTRSIEATDLRQFGINVSQTGARPPLTVLFTNSPNYQNPTNQQGSFGIEREIVKDFSVGLSYVYVRGLQLTTSYDSNLLPAPVNAAGFRDWGPSAANPTGAAFFKDPLLFQNNVYESGANSKFHGMIFEANKRLRGANRIAFNYTFSKAMDETTDYNSDFQPNDQTCRRCEWALSSFDQRHKVVAYAMLELPWKIGFTPIFRYNSGRPFNLLAGTEINNDRHNTTDRPVFAGRNTGLGPSFATFDTRISRRIKTGERSQLELMAEFFNLFNKLNYASVNNTVGNIAGPFNLTGRDDRTALQPLGFTAAYEPRRIQLGLRFSF